MTMAAVMTEGGMTADVIAEMTGETVTVTVTLAICNKPGTT